MKLRSSCRYKSDTVISQANQPLTSSSDSTLSFPARKSKKPKGCTTINTAPANRSGVDQTASVSDIPRATEKHQASNRSNSNSPQVSSSCVTNLSFPVLASPQCTVDIDSTHFGVKLRKNRTSTSAVAYSQCSSAICEGASAELTALTVLGSTDTPAVKPRARNSKRAKSVVYRKEIVSHSRQPLTGEERQSHRSGSSNCSNTDSLVQHIEQPSVSGVAGIGAELLVPAKCGESCTASEPSEKRRCLRSCWSKSAEAVLEIPAPSVQEPADEKPKPSVGRKAGVVTSEGLHSTSSRRRSLKGKKTGSCASSSGQYSSASGNLRQVSVPAVFSCLNFSTSSALQLHHTAAKPSTSSSLIYQVPCDSMSGQEMSNTDRATSRGHNSSESTEASGFGTRHREDAGSLISTSRPDQDGDEVEMGRLQALLEARGLPSHLFGALGPRMHQLLHRTMTGGSSLSKVQQLIHGLQATGDEDQQLTAAMEMCQLLVMGTEDNLVGFPVKQAVPPLIALLQLEHNFDIMNHACRALTYMMEALPRSSTVVVDAVPVFLEKLQVIQCMDVAEQALTALETLSKRHSKAILQHNGIAACLTYIDFFSAAAQRSALMVAANCAQSMTHDEFRSMSDCLPVLTGRLSHADKKSIESVCLCFSRLVDNFHSDQRILKEILVHGLLSNIQQLVMVSPPVISISIFVMVIRMLAIMCSNCPDLAVLLLKQKISDTLCYLLVGPSDQRLTGSIELVSRTPQELYELVSLIGELLPNLPCEGVFAIDAVLRKGPSVNCEAVIWQWQDDRSTWHSYMPIDSKIIEAAYQAGEDEVCLSASGRSYSVDYNSMQQVNEDTGTSRPVQRKVNPLSVGSFSRNAPVSTYSADPDVDRCDARAEILKEDYQLTSNFIQTLFAVLYEVYSCSAGPSVRHKCLQTILRTIYYASPDLLRQMLKTQPVSSHIAAMMASPDLKVVVGAFQMADILMQKLPDIFGVFFRREGVMHQVKHITNTLCASSAPVPATMTASFSSSQRSFALQGHAPDVRASSDLTTESRCQLMAPVPVVMAAMTTSVSSSFQRLSGDNRLMKSAARSQSASSSCLLTSVPVPADEPALSHLRLGDVLKRKRPAKRVAARRAKCEDSCADPVPRGSQPTGRSFASRNKAVGKDLKNSSGTGSKVSSFLPSFNPRSWGRFGSSEHHTQVKQESIPARPIVSNLAMNKEKIRSWIKEQADRFLERYFPSTSGVPHPAHGVLNSLTAACQHLTAEGGGMLQLKTIGIVVKESDVSPFEVIHSGLIQALLQFLTSQAMSTERDLRLRQFLHVFLNCPEHPVTQVTEEFTGVDQPYLFYLIGKLMGCLHQLEQFQVKIHDLPGAGGVNGRGSSALKFLTTHQLKCQLQRHPSCTGLRQWKAGPVKIDPLALVQAIERYLVMRGYGNVKEGDDDVSDDDNSDEEMEDSMAAMFIGSQGNMQHRLEFVIGDRVLPYNMTVYQAIRQFTPPSDRDPTDTDPDPDNPLGHTGIWVQTHTIWYRPAPNQHNVSTTDIMKTKLSSKGSRSSRKKDNTGPHPIKVPMMYSSLSDSLPSFVTVSDASLQTIALLRVLDTLNRHWASLYNVYFLPKPVVPASEFISSKLMAKATRQMQDPLIIMTGNLPPWLIQIGRAAPFLFPFDARQMLFAATVLDRDRAMLRLQQETSGLVDSAGHDTERLGPRLDRRKKTVNRACILKQAEKIMDEMVNSKAMLEVQYEDEVGTGLGPTLEFYALVSREMQRADLELWWGERVQCPHLAGAGSSAVEYMHSPLGLFPSPLARSAKISSVNRTKSKFRFLGKFMAKALLDNRLIDIPLCLPFYKWMLGQERSFGTADLHTIDPQLASFFQELESLLHQRRLIIADQSHTEDSRQVALDSLLLASGGSRVQDLDLTFLVPGTDVELKRGGKDVQVTLQNLQEYVKLAVHWMLVEGVHRQLEAFQQGFEAFMPLSSLQCFYPEELEQVFCGSHWIPWDVKMLMDHCRPDHGYTHDSSAIQHLFQILASYDKEQQRQFLQFVTGSPRLPVGGFRTLNPALTIVRKDRDEPDEVLPSVMTCVNYLKLPDYSSLETMRQKLHIAASEGQLSFHLS